jgi:hypothetical protein
MDDCLIEQLDRTHIRNRFECRKPTLDDFIRTLVSQYEKRNLGRTYVAVGATERRILGYSFAITCAKVDSWLTIGALVFFSPYQAGSLRW